MDLYNKYRSLHKKFIYHDYKIDEGGFSFHFSIDDVHFHPSWTHNIAVNSINAEYYAHLIFNLGMAELVSYWKCACPEIVQINCGALDDYQIEWWKKLYKNGLQEFFYINNICPGDDFMTIMPSSKKSPDFVFDNQYSGCLIPVGGGKDSVVTMELLGTADNLCYMINPRRASLETAEISGFDENRIIRVHRTIDGELLRLNSEGYLNGHTPFSAIVAFSSYIFACLAGKKHIVLSNESSANESNISGTQINHQYSKSTEFEADFREYTAYSFQKSPQYFSLLRPWSEWQITKKFVSFGKYLETFQSCNVGTKTDTWCGKCAKCLYVYVMLAAFIDDDKLIRIFGVNMLDNELFSDMLDGLVFENHNKPFECVGTREEICYALMQAYKMRKNNVRIPTLLKNYISKCKTHIESDFDNYFDNNHFIPEEFLRILQ